MPQVLLSNHSNHNSEVSKEVPLHLCDTATRPHTCRHCDDIIIDGSIDFINPIRLLRTYKAIDDLLQANRECLFIRSTLAQWLDVVHQYESDRSISGGKGWRKYLFWFASKIRPRPSFDLYVEFKFGTPHYSEGKNLWALELQWTIGNLWSDNSYFLVHTEETANLIHSRPMNKDPCSGKTFDIARRWLQDHVGHSLPPLTSSPASRLLDLGEKSLENGDHQIRLVSPKGFEKFAALSYCWGSRGKNDEPEYFTATSTTLAEGYIGITTSRLPLTIQDAVTVTRNLGIRYLWVDRLCIVQDDKTDLYKQLGHMPTIYRYAYVTISAASAKNCEEGFLRPRCDPGVAEKANVQIKIRKQTEDASGKLLEQTGPITLQPLKKEKDLKSDLIEPIQERAWTMQEHLLSQKVLVFGFRQLRCVCSDTQLTDGGRNTVDLCLPFPFLSVNKDSPFHTLPAIRADQYTSQYSWDAIIFEYSQRQLSHPEDKLVALGGLAQRFCELMEYKSEDYLGGLWRQNLMHQLLWTPKDGQLLPRPKEKDEKDSDTMTITYRAPSWSWASIDSVIDSQFGFRLFKPGHQWRFRDRYSICPKVIEAYCTPLSALNPFGAITDGCITCQGHVRQAELAYSGGVYTLKSEGSRISPGVYFDTVWENSGIKEEARYFNCLVLASAPLFRYAGLLLVEMECGVFRREGIWKFDVDQIRGMSEKSFTRERENWFKGCSLRTIKII